MSRTLLPATPEIRDAFCDAVQSHGGTVTESIIHGGTVTDGIMHGEAIFLRATLPKIEQVQRRDEVRAGVALRSFERALVVHPYVFRQVCRNGAILTRAIDSQRIKRVRFSASNEAIDGVLDEVREAVANCARGSSFDNAVRDMRHAIAERTAVDELLNAIPMFSRIPRGMERAVAEILSRFTASRDQSPFGLMNAITSVARDTEDPELKWQLEELGGGVPALVLPRVSPGGAAADLLRV